MGLVSASLLDEAKPWPLSLAVGSHLTSHRILARVTTSPCEDGDSSIGRAGNSGLQLDLSGGYSCSFGSSLDRSILLKHVR